MESVSNFLQKGVIIADKVCDYIPFYSLRNNGICLIAKGILYGVESYSSSVYAKIKESHLVKHLEQKNIYQCVLLSIPLLNIFVAIVRDFPECIDAFTRPSKSQEHFDKEMNDLQETVTKQHEDFRKQAESLEKQRRVDYEISKKKEEESFDLKIKEYQEKLAAEPADTKEGMRKREIILKYIQTLTEAQSTIKMLNIMHGFN